MMGIYNQLTTSWKIINLWRDFPIKTIIYGRSKTSSNQRGRYTTKKSSFYSWVNQTISMVIFKKHPPAAVPFSQKMVILK